MKYILSILSNLKQKIIDMISVGFVFIKRFIISNIKLAYVIAFFRYANNSTFWFVIVVLIAINGFFRLSIIPSSSMEPTIYPGDMIFVTKFNYGYKRSSIPLQVVFQKILPQFSVFEKMPKRGDIIVFWDAQSSKYMIKRVIGLPRDSIFVYDGFVFINDQPLLYKRVRDKSQSLRTKYQVTLPNKRMFNVYDSGNSIADNTAKYIVPENHVFVIGDNMDNSADSRFTGPVHLNNIIGKPLFFVASFSWEFPFISFYKTFSIVS